MPWAADRAAPGGRCASVDIRGAGRWAGRPAWMVAWWRVRPRKSSGLWPGLTRSPRAA